LLADGRTVPDIASRVGYQSVNGYVNAFRKQFCHTPAAHPSRRQLANPVPVAIGARSTRCAGRR